MVTYLEHEDRWIVTSRESGKQVKKFKTRDKAKKFDEELAKRKEAKGIKKLR